MVLEYKLFSKLGIKVMRWESAPGGRKEYMFSPRCDVPDELAQKILDQIPQEFRAVGEVKTLPTPEKAPVQSFKCPTCEFESASKVGISAHIRFKHKEKQNEVPA